MHSAYCIENPLLDHLMRQDYAWLERFGARPGTMQLVPRETFDMLLSASSSHVVSPGGSGANAIRALALLVGPDAAKYGRPAYSGAVGRDEAGRAFASILSGMGIDVALAEKDEPTGVSGVVVTPDHERTMFTYLGACRHFAPEDAAWDFLRDARIFYTTGYMWDTESQLATLRAVAAKASEWGVPIAFDLADPFVVDRYRAELSEWVRGRVSVLFANRDELSRMTGRVGEDEDILLAAADLAETVVMKVGARGCLVLHGGRVAARIPGERVQAVDSTGAGDSFAGGFLYGLIRGLRLDDCGRLANRIAARVVAQEGCRVDLLDRSEILSVLDR